MPIAPRTATSGTAASSASFSVTLPGSTATGDFLLVGVTNAGTTGPAAPTGWNRFYSVSAGSGQCFSAYSAQYSASLTLSFTNAASAAAWVCDAYFMTGRRIVVDTSLATTNTSNNSTLPTGAPVTGTVSGDYEALLYGWTSAATVTTPASGSTIDQTQANSTSCSACLGHNNTTSLGASTTCTAFSHTLSATNTRKTGLGVTLIPQVLEDLTASAAGVGASSAGTITHAKNLTGTSPGAATASGAATKRPKYLYATPAGVAVASATLSNRRHLIAIAYGVSAINSSNTSSMVFDGTDDYATSTTNISALNLVGDQTIEMWAKNETVPDISWPGQPWHFYYQFLYSKGDAFAGNSPFELVVRDNYLRVMWGNGGFWYEDDSVYLGDIPFSGWHHFAFTYTVSTHILRIYVDGALSYTGGAITAEPVTNTSPALIGAYNDSTYITQPHSALFWKGKIDEVRIWSVVRTGSQISADMRHQILSSTSGLVALWRANEGTGTTVADLTGSATMTLTNGATWSTTDLPLLSGITAITHAKNVTGSSAGVGAASGAVSKTTPTTFGYSTAGTAGDDNPAPNWVWCKATSLPSAGTLVSISVRAKIRAGLTPVAPAVTLYSDSSGQPGTRLATEIQTSTTPGSSYAWLVASGFSISLIAGTQYWFGIRAPHYAGAVNQNDFFVAFDTNSAALEAYYKPATGAEPNLDPLPNPAGSSLIGFTDERWSIYGTYTTAGASYKDLTGSSAGSASVSVTVSRRASLTAASAGVAIDSVTIGRRRSLTGTSPGVATVSTTIGKRPQFSGNAGGLSTSDGVVSARRSLTGTSPGIGVSAAVLAGPQQQPELRGKSIGNQMRQVLSI